MKHAREDYNRIQDPAGLIPEDEPVFLLRGQDPLAPNLLIQWAKKLHLLGGDIKMAELVEDQAEAMIKWQKDHGSHLPDLPE